MHTEAMQALTQLFHSASAIWPDVSASSIIGFARMQGAQFRNEEAYDLIRALKKLPGALGKTTCEAIPYTIWDSPTLETAGSADVLPADTTTSLASDDENEKSSAESSAYNKRARASADLNGISFNIKTNPDGLDKKPDAEYLVASASPAQAATPPPLPSAKKQTTDPAPTRDGTLSRTMPEVDFGELEPAVQAVLAIAQIPGWKTPAFRFHLAETRRKHGEDALDHALNEAVRVGKPWLRWIRVVAAAYRAPAFGLFADTQTAPARTPRPAERLDASARTHAVADVVAPPADPVPRPLSANPIVRAIQERALKHRDELRADPHARARIDAEEARISAARAQAQQHRRAFPVFADPPWRRVDMPSPGSRSA